MLRLIPEYPPVIIGAHPPRCLPAAGRQVEVDDRRSSGRRSQERFFVIGYQLSGLENSPFRSDRVSGNCDLARTPARMCLMKCA